MNRRTNIFLITIIVLAFLFAVSCSKKEAPLEGVIDEESYDKTMAEAPGMTGEFAPAPSAPGMVTGPAGTPATVPRPTEKKRKIIKTAELKIEVKDYKKSFERIKEIIKEVAPSDMDGIIADSSESKSNTGAVSGTVVIRINPEKFDLLVDKLLTVGDVKYQRISGEDVTKEYYDLQARLMSKQEMEKRLIQLLATRTNSVADLLEVERELGRVREEIESIQGTLRYYDDLVGMSTVNLTIFEPDSMVSGAGGFWGPIKEALKDSFEALGKSIAVLIAFIVIILPWFIAAFVVFVIVRAIVRNRRKGSAQPAPDKSKGK